MNVLEDIVDVQPDVEESEDLFTEEIDQDRDPDYVQPEPQAGSSKFKGKAPVLYLVSVTTNDTTGKRVALHPGWSHW